jgi:hypothetical protein
MGLFGPGKATASVPASVTRAKGIKTAAKAARRGGTAIRPAQKTKPAQQ